MEPPKIVDTCEIYEDKWTYWEDNKPLPRKKYIFVEMDGFHFDSAESENLVDFIQSIVDYKRQEQNDKKSTYT